MTKWNVLFHNEFEPEFDELAKEVQDELLAYARLLEANGPTLGRPYADTLKGSRYANMKELRFRVGDGLWRVAFAFDPRREAIVLVAGNKAGVNQRRFYQQLILQADRRFQSYLRELESSGE